MHFGSKSSVALGKRSRVAEAQTNRKGSNQASTPDLRSGSSSSSSSAGAVGSKPLIQEIDKSSKADKDRKREKERQEPEERVEKDEKVENGERKSKKQRFAWMDSGDEGSAGSDDEEEEPESTSTGNVAARKSSGSPKRGDLCPSNANDVQTFAQMVRYAEKVQNKITEMNIEDLAGVCQALSRVKFYDGELLEKVNQTLRRLLRRGRPGESQNPHKPEHVIGVVAGLADVNAYDKDIFESALQAIRHQPLTPVIREKIVTVYITQVKHKSSSAGPFLQQLSIDVKNTRYERMAEEVATSWQKRGPEQRNQQYWWT